MFSKGLDFLIATKRPTSCGGDGDTLVCFYTIEKQAQHGLDQLDKLKAGSDEDRWLGPDRIRESDRRTGSAGSR